MKTKRFLSLLLCAILIAAMLPAGGVSAASSENDGSAANGFVNPFEDVGPGDWFYDDVAFAYSSGLMNGTGTEARLFSPGVSLSRAMLVTVLYRLSGSPAASGLSNAFDDVPEGSWYRDAVAWAAANGIIKGVGGGRFAPEENVTREQAATILLRYARLIGKGPEGELAGAGFADEDEIAPWALEGAAWCEKVGVITGKPGANGLIFDPRGSATRAELAAMVHRFAEKVTGAEPDKKSGDEQTSSDPSSGYMPAGGASLQVAFETNGGTAIAPVSVPQGATLSDVPVPLKDNYVFTGWYTDSGLTKPFLSGVPITESLTLYASYDEKDHNYKEYVDSVKYLPDCEPDAAFELISPEEITEANINDYITIKNKSNGDETPAATVTDLGGGVYSVSPKAPYSYTPGDTYELTLLKESLSFNNEKVEVRTLAFTIKKPQTYDVRFNDGIAYLLWSQVNALDDGVYTLTKALAEAKRIAVGTVVCLTDELDTSGQGILNENSKLRKVLSVVDTDSADPPRVMLLTEAAEVKDVYDQLDVYVTQSVNPESVANSINVEELAQQAKNSEGALKLTKLLAVALNESKTVASLSSSGGVKLLSGSSSGFDKPTENDDKLSLYVKGLVSGLTVTASVGTASNTNFKDAADNTWVVLTLKFSYNATIQKIYVKADFTFKEFIALEAGGKTGLNTENGIYFDAWIDAYSQTDMEFNILVKTVDVDTEFLNITDEINKLISGLTKDNSEVPEVIREVLGSKGDYIDLLEVNILEKTQDIKMPAPVFQIKEKLDFVIRLNLAAGLSVQSTLLSASRIGIRGGTGLDLQTYRYALEGDGRQSLDLYCAGYLGLKAGLKLTVSVCFFGLEDLGRVGFTGEVGAYMDLYGFLQLHLLKSGGKPDINMNGGIYMEVGIYLELKLFAESKTFSVKAELSVLDLKFPLYTLGNRYVLYRFKNAGKSIIINQNEFYLSKGGIFDCEMLDLTTGELVPGDYSKLNKFKYDAVSNPFMIDWLNYDHIIVQPQYFGITYYGVYVAKDTQRLDGTVRVYYGGDNLCFSSREKGYIYNEIKLIWIKPGVDPKTVNLDTVTATYVVNMDGKKVGETKKYVPAGSVPGAIDLSSWTNPIEGLIGYQEAEVAGYVGDWNQAIWEDAAYVVNMTKKQVLISYIYLYDGQWRYEIYAAENGDTPPLPSNYKSPGTACTFKDWMRRDYRFINYSYPTTSNEPLKNLDIYSAWTQGMTFTGYDKTKPVYTFTGTLDECNAKFKENQTKIPVLFHNVAEYSDVRVDITFYYPRMQYTAYGKNFDIWYRSETYSFNFGSIPLPWHEKSYPGCVFSGWNQDYTNIVKWDYNNLPPATEKTYYNLIVEFKGEYRAIFKTDMGTFTDGSTEADSGKIPYPDFLKYTEDFMNANNALTIQPVSKDGLLYRFSRWESDTTNSEPNTLALKAVWELVAGQEFTVVFDAGEGASFYGGNTSVSFNLPYCTRLNLSNFDPSKPADNYHTYTLSGWRDSDGNTYGLTDDIVIRKNTTYTALYTAIDKIYTVTVSAGSGTFPDGSAVKTFTGKYGEPTNISLSDPEWKTNYANFYYVFDGWSEVLPREFTQNLTVTANYRQVYYEYRITFDAGSGSFEDGSITVTQPYRYGAEIVPPANPAKAESEYFRYEFTGWSPALNAGDTVTGDRTYTANYRSFPKGATLPEAGITVTDGEVTEDISVGSISGYTYEMVDYYGDTLPTLTITGDGLTFSGANDNIYVRIEGTASSVTFSNLSVASEGKAEGVYIQESDAPLAVNIEGRCAFSVESTESAPEALRAERPAIFRGTDKTADSLTVSSNAGQALCVFGSLTFESIRLSLSAKSYAFTADAGSGDEYACSFNKSDVDIIVSDGDGFEFAGGFDVEIINSVFSMDCVGLAGCIGDLSVEASNVTIKAGSGLWLAGTAEFSGAFDVKIDADTALSAAGGISVPEGCDLGGTSIRQFSNGELGDYYALAVQTEGGVWAPASAVEINNP